MTLIKSISGIRGTIGGIPDDGLTPVDIVKYVSAYGTFLKLRDPSLKKIIIGRDARVSGQLVSNMVCSTLQFLGFDVLDLGLSTTPTVEMAVQMEGDTAGGIILTASHNPMQWNALKLLNEKGEFISSDDGKQLLDLAKTAKFEYADVKKLGTYTKDDTYLQKHIKAILALDLVNVAAIRKAHFSIIVDSVNSSGGIAIPALLEALGVKNVKSINGEPTGLFAHNPEPLPKHLNQICGELQNGNFDLGIVVDPDVDRLAFVCEDGEPFGEEYTLVALADYILSKTKEKGQNTVSNLSSSMALKVVTEKNGGTYSASKVGEVNVVAEMKKVNAIIGGEGNGGIIYPELHYGRDALVGVALFLTQLAEFGKPVGFLRKSYPNYHIAKNKIDIVDGLNVDQILEKVKNKYKKYETDTQDGIKIIFDNEWVHLRKSNTEPIVRIYAESEFETTAENLAEKIMADIREFMK